MKQDKGKQTASGQERPVSIKDVPVLKTGLTKRETFGLSDRKPRGPKRDK